MSKTNELMEVQAIGVAIIPTSEKDLSMFHNVAKFSTYEVLEITNERVYFALNCGERHRPSYAKLRNDTNGNYFLINKQPFYLKDLLHGLTWKKNQ